MACELSFSLVYDERKEEKLGMCKSRCESKDMIIINLMVWQMLVAVTELESFSVGFLCSTFSVKIIRC